MNTNRPTLNQRVRSAIMLAGGNQGALITHREQAWASVSFSGTKHSFELEFKDIEIGERFAADLPDMEFHFEGQLVAEVSVTEVKSTVRPKRRVLVKFTVLLLEDK